MAYWERLRAGLTALLEREGWDGETVQVRARTLSPREVIGDPEARDYPLIAGRERMMAARVRGAEGQAFTDRFGEFEGSLGEVARMPLANNFRRAVFLATLNAVLRAKGTVQGTVHCRDDAPPRCAAKLAEHLATRFGRPRVGLVGLQPRMAEVLAARFELRITDLDQANQGQERHGVRVEGPEATPDLLSWCDVALVTGSTFCNQTAEPMLAGRRVIFYGVTAAGAASLLGRERFCPCST